MANKGINFGSVYGRTMENLNRDMHIPAIRKLNTHTEKNLQTWWIKK